jgi:multidrug efflux pump subunit AcrA (membrane-fusion protein)
MSSHFVSARFCKPQARPWEFPRLRFGLVGMILLAMVQLGCGKATPPPEKAPPATVKWESASQLSLAEWTELVGTTVPLPEHLARVSSPVDARVRTVMPTAYLLATGFGAPLVAEGQRVGRGAVVVQLEDTIIRSNLAKLEATQDSIQEEQKQAQFAVDLATAEMNRLLKLKEEDDKRPRGSSFVPLVNTVDMERAANALKDAQSKFNGARFRQIAGTKDIEALKEQLRLYAVAAPIPGRVGRVLVVPGQWLAAGTPVAEIVDLDDEIDVLCFVPPRLAGSLKVGQEARSGPVEKDPADTEPDAKGYIAYIAEQAESETGNFAVKVRLSNKQTHFGANRVLHVSVLTTPPKECLALPESAVMEDEELPSVIIVVNVKTATNDEGKEETTGEAKRLQVELGVRDRTLHRVEILRLIDPEKDADKKWKGDLKEAQFVVEGGLGLQSGDNVKLDAGDD